MTEAWRICTIGGLPRWVRAVDGAVREVLFASSYPAGVQAITAEVATSTGRRLRVARGTQAPTWVTQPPRPATEPAWWLDAADPRYGVGSTVEITTPETKA